jgi:hypothetical protein
MEVPISAAYIYGDPEYDLPVLVTHADLPDDMITLDGTYACQDGGADIAASSDSLGTTQIPLYVRRCDLDATPANSRVQIWVRRQDISDTVDTSFWLWWGSETETAPAVDDPYGRNDVFGGDVTGGVTGTGSPVLFDAVYLFDEDPGDPAPQYKDHTGNGHDATVQNNGTATLTRADASGLNVRGARLVNPIGEEGAYLTTGWTWAPGTGDFSVVWVGVPGTGFFSSTGNSSASSYVILRSTLSFVAFTDEITASGDGLDSSGTIWCASRSGDDVTVFEGTGSTPNTGLESASMSITGLMPISRYSDFGDHNRVFIGYTSIALNAYWVRAVYDQYTSTILGTLGDIEATAVPTTLTIHCIDAATLADVVGARVYLVAGATGNLTEGEELANDVTGSSGTLDTVIEIDAVQSIEGWTRKGTASPFYKQGLVQGTITPGVDVTWAIPMTLDE